MKTQGLVNVLNKVLSIKANKLVKHRNHIGSFNFNLECMPKYFIEKKRCISKFFNRLLLVESSKKITHTEFM